jgi:hypothetical protein
MLVNLPFLLLALLLLWFPRQWMRLGLSVWKRRRHSGEVVVSREQDPWKTDEPGNRAVKFGAEFVKLRNYVDLLRATVGSVAVMGGFNIDASLDAAPRASPTVIGEVLALKLAILLVGVVVQTVRYERHRLLFFAPIFFLFGLSNGLCGLETAGFAFVLIWAVNPMLKNPQGFLSVYALLVGGFGFFFLETNYELSIATLVFCFLPVLLSLLAQRPLVLFTRKSTRAPGARL